jgi:hypothetical protein
MRGGEKNSGKFPCHLQRIKIKARLIVASKQHTKKKLIRLDDQCESSYAQKNQYTDRN